MIFSQNYSIIKPFNDSCMYHSDSKNCMCMMSNDNYNDHRGSKSIGGGGSPINVDSLSKHSSFWNNKYSLKKKKIFL